MKNRKTLTFFVCVLAAPLCAQMLPGVSADPPQMAVLAGAALGLGYLLLRPILRLLTFPIGCLTLGLSGFVLDMGLIWLLTQAVDGFSVEGVYSLILFALLVDGLCLITGGAR